MLQEHNSKQYRCGVFARTCMYPISSRTLSKRLALYDSTKINFKAFMTLTCSHSIFLTYLQCHKPVQTKDKSVLYWVHKSGFLLCLIHDTAHTFPELKQLDTDSNADWIPSTIVYTVIGRFTCTKICPK